MESRTESLAREAFNARSALDAALATSKNADLALINAQNEDNVALVHENRRAQETYDSLSRLHSQFMTKNNALYDKHEALKATEEQTRQQLQESQLRARTAEMKTQSLHLDLESERKECVSARNLVTDLQTKLETQQQLHKSEKDEHNETIRLLQLRQQETAHSLKWMTQHRLHEVREDSDNDAETAYATMHYATVVDEERQRICRLHEQSLINHDLALAKKKQEISSLKKCCTNLQHDKDTTKRELGESKAAHEKSEADHERSKTGLQGSIQLLKNIRDNLKQELAIGKSEFREASAGRDNLARDNRRKQIRVTELKSELSQVTGKKEELEQALIEERSKGAASKAECSRLVEKKSTDEQAWAEVLKEKDDEIERLNTQGMALEERASGLEKELEDQKQIATDLQEEHDRDVKASHTVAAELSHSLVEKEARVAKAKDDYSRSLREIESLKIQIQALEQGWEDQCPEAIKSQESDKQPAGDGKRSRTASHEPHDSMSIALPSHSHETSRKPDDTPPHITAAEQRTIEHSDLFVYDQRLGLDSSQWYHASRQQFAAFPNDTKRRYRHIACLMFENAGVVAKVPCTRCRNAGKVCTVYKRGEGPPSCAYCLPINRTCDAEAPSVQTEDLAHGQILEVNFSPDDTGRLQRQQETPESIGEKTPQWAQTISPESKPKRSSFSTPSDTSRPTRPTTPQSNTGDRVGSDNKRPAEYDIDQRQSKSQCKAQRKA